MRISMLTSAAMLAMLSALGAAQAQTTAIKVGKIVGGSGFHTPSYVAMDRGFFKEEGLDATFVEMPGAVLVKAGMVGQIDFVPIPSGGAQLALSGGDLRYVVGQSLKSQWLFASRQNISKPEDLRGKVIAYGRVGSADYDEGAEVLRRSFKMEVGKDYKVISLAGEPERIAALANGSVDAALISVPHAPKALSAGMKLLFRTGDHIQRAGGTFWARKEFVDKNPETTKKFIRAIAKGVMFFRDNKAGSLRALKEHLGATSDQEAEIVWEQTHMTFGAELPPALFREILDSRRITMVAAKQWAEDKPLPDPEQFLTRALLEQTLKEMNYIPTKLDAPSN